MGKVYSLAIIGCGLTGTSMLYQFIKSLPASAGTKLSLVVFEKSNQPGPGLPYADENTFPFHLCNMPAEDMSIVADHRDDFIAWVNRNRQTLMQEYPDLLPFLMPQQSRLPGTICLPRLVMGHYLKGRFNDALQMASEKNVDILVQNKVEVTGLNDLVHSLSIKTVDLNTKRKKHFTAKHVLLATGHWFENNKHGRYFPSPWPAQKLLKSIPEGTETAILGTSLSAIDTALTLSSGGTYSKNKSGRLSYHPGQNPRQVTMYSRNGLLPKVRGQKGIYKSTHFTESGLNNILGQKNGPALLKDFFYVLSKELEDAYDQKIDWKAILKPEKDPLSILDEDISNAIKGDNPDGDILWQTILSQVTPLLKKAYLNLTNSQRTRFETQYKSIFMTYAAPMPLSNAENIYALIKSGILTVKAFQSTYRIESSSKAGTFKICYQDRSGKNVCDRHQFIVNATGQKRSYRTNPSCLAQSIISSGLILLDEYNDNDSDNNEVQQPPSMTGTKSGGIRIDPKTFGVLKKTRPDLIGSSNKIFAIGMMNGSQIINASMAYECAMSAKKVGTILLNQLISSNQ